MLFQNTIIFPATNVCERHRILRADAPLTMPSVVHLLPCVRPGSQPPGFSVRARCNVISTSLVSCHYSFLIGSYYSTSEKMSITFFQLFFLCQNHVSLMHSDVLQVPAILRRYHQPLQQSSCSPRCSQVLRLNVLSLPRLLPRLSGYYPRLPHSTVPEKIPVRSAPLSTDGYPGSGLQSSRSSMQSQSLLCSVTYCYQSGS